MRGFAGLRSRVENCKSPSAIHHYSAHPDFFLVLDAVVCHVQCEGFTWDGQAGLGHPPWEGVGVATMGEVCKGGVEWVFKRVLNALRLDSLGEYCTRLDLECT